MIGTSHFSVDGGNIVRICQTSSFEVYIDRFQFIQDDGFMIQENALLQMITIDT